MARAAGMSEVCWSAVPMATVWPCTQSEPADATAQMGSRRIEVCSLETRALHVVQSADTTDLRSIECA